MLAGVTKEALTVAKFKQVGRVPRFYDTSASQTIRQHNLDVWPGYSIVPQVYTGGLYFNIDAVTKFIQNQPVLDILSEMAFRDKLSHDKIKDILLKRERRVPGFSVITKWGKQLSY